MDGDNMESVKGVIHEILRDENNHPGRGQILSNDYLGESTNGEKTTIFYSDGKGRVFATTDQRYGCKGKRYGLFSREHYKFLGQVEARGSTESGEHLAVRTQNGDLLYVGDIVKGKIGVTCKKLKDMEHFQDIVSGMSGFEPYTGTGEPTEPIKKVPENQDDLDFISCMSAGKEPNIREELLYDDEGPAGNYKYVFGFEINFDIDLAREINKQRAREKREKDQR